MRPYLRSPWTDSHQIWAVDVFHHASKCWFCFCFLFFCEVTSVLYWTSIKIPGTDLSNFKSTTVNVQWMYTPWRAKQIYTRRRWWHYAFERTSSSTQSASDIFNTLPCIFISSSAFWLAHHDVACRVPECISNFWYRGCAFNDRLTWNEGIKQAYYPVTWTIQNNTVFEPWIPFLYITLSAGIRS